jgi:hypothetical protein
VFLGSDTCAIAVHRAALLMNVNMTTLRAGLKKLVHPDLYEKRHVGRADQSVSFPISAPLAQVESS